MSAVVTTNEHFHSKCTVNCLYPYEGHAQRSTKMLLYVNNGGRLKSVSLHVTNKEHFFCKVRTSIIPTYKKAMLHQYRKKMKKKLQGKVHHSDLVVTFALIAAPEIREATRCKLLSRLPLRSCFIPENQVKPRPIQCSTRNPVVCQQ